MSKIVLGQIDYLDCLPVYYALEEFLSPLKIELVKSIPSDLNQKFLKGQLDITPISSIEYARNIDKCIILPNLSVSADGRTESVLLFSKIPITELDGKTVTLSSSSATAVILLKILFSHYYHVDVDFQVKKPNLNKMLTDADAALLIGDDALNASYEYSKQKTKKMFITDLGEVWKTFANEKMVYALWVVRKEFAENNPELVNMVASALRQSRDISCANLPFLINNAQKSRGLPKKVLEDYFKIINNNLTEDAKRGLITYYDYAYKSGFIEERVQLNIWGENVVPNLSHTG